MATLLSSIISRARLKLLEETATFWTDAELLSDVLAGCKDMWGSILNLREEHFFTVDITNVSLAANTGTITGVPSDVFRVILIEPRVTTQGTTGHAVSFVPKEYKSDEFREALASAAFDPGQGGEVCYAISGAGAPTGAPTIYVAPQLSSALNLRLVYLPTLSSSLTAASNNPIPGESDNALVAWTIAWARAKERDDASPDPSWLAIYANEKSNILVRLAPRQDQEPQYSTGIFQDYWP